MKYIYGKRIKTLKNRVTTLVASLAILANSAGVALPVLLTQKAYADDSIPAITNVDAYYKSGTGYTGIGVDFKTNGLSDASLIKSVTVSLNNFSGGEYSISGTSSLFDIVATNSGTGTSTSSTVIITGSRTSGNWSNQNGSWHGPERPDTATVTIALNDTANTVLTNSDSNIVENSGNTEASVFASVPEITYLVAGVRDTASYKGISVNTGTENITDAKAISVTLKRADGSTVVKNSRPAPSGSVNGVNSGETTTPFIIQHGTYDEAVSTSWFPAPATWNKETRPTEVTVLITLADDTTISKTTLLSINQSEYEALLPPDTTDPTATLSLTGGKVVNGLRYVRPGDTIKYVVSAYDSESGLNRASNVVFKLKTNGVSQDGSVCGSWSNGQFPSGSNTLTGSFTMTNCNGGTAPEDRLYGFAVRVYDNAGNYLRIPNSVFAVDGTDPSLSDFNTTNLASSTLNVSVKATDATSGVEYVRFYIAETQNGVCKNNYPALPGYLNIVNSSNSGEYSTSFDTSALNGEYCILVSARDNATNNSAPLFKKITIDNTAPSVSIVAPIVDLSNTSQEVRITVNDDNLRHYWVQIKRNDVVLMSETTLSTGVDNQLVAVLSDDGDYVITVAARDSVGGGSDTGNRSADVVKTITIDGTAPVIDIDDVTVNAGKLSFNLSATDAVSGLKIVAANIYDETNSTKLIELGEGSPSRLNTPHPGLPLRTNSFDITLDDIDVSGLASGVYTIRAYASDHAGNERRFKLVQFTVDNDPVLTADYFTVHSDQIAVGFSVDKFDDATSVEVAIFDASDNLITTNTGTSTDMLNLLNSTTGQISSPFYIPFQVASDGFWQFGNADWASVTPAYATVTINYSSGSLTDAVDFVPVNVDIPSQTYAALIAALPPAGGGGGGNGGGGLDGENEGTVAGANTGTPSNNDRSNPGRNAATRGGQNNLALATEAGENPEETPADARVLQATDTANGSDTSGENETEENNGCGKFLGLCWYLWIPIIIAVLGTVYYFSSRRADEK